MPAVAFRTIPNDYAVIDQLAARDELTVRIAYNLFTQRPKQELEDFEQWSKLVKPGQGTDFYRMNGAGEMLVFSAADFEDFLEPRPELPASMDEDLTKVVRLLARNRWPFRMHATYNESITRALNVFESVNREIPLAGLHWFIDHAETIDARNIDRIKALGGGIAIQHRMAYQGEYFVERYGAAKAANSPPVRQMLAAGVPVGAGTDATRVASYNPWVSLYWLVAGRTVGGLQLYDERKQAGSDDGAAPLDRRQCLVLLGGWQEGTLGRGSARGCRRAIGGLLPGAGRSHQGHHFHSDRCGRTGRPWRWTVRLARTTAAVGFARLVTGACLWRLRCQRLGSGCERRRGISAQAHRPRLH